MRDRVEAGSAHSLLELGRAREAPHARREVAVGGAARQCLAGERDQPVEPGPVEQRQRPLRADDLEDPEPPARPYDPAELAQPGVEVGVCASAAGIEVLATELYGEPRLPRDEVLARFTEGVDEAVSVYDPHDYSAPYASGSARVDGYVVCPCSMATAGTIATGREANLVHRAAGVALKEGRKLVLVPRETPLSAIHLENLLRLRQAGAVILFAAPGFYHGAETIDDLVDFVVARCLAQLGLESSLVKPWGDE